PNNMRNFTSMPPPSMAMPQLHRSHDDQIQNDYLPRSTTSFNPHHQNQQPPFHIQQKIFESQQRLNIITERIERDKA
ncbi:MAG: hypothetical protein MHPSP_004068, partial [Paramarteilia canceri]